MTDDIWTKRLKWVEARKASENNFEKLLLGLKIAHYDYVVARKYSNREGAKKARIRIRDIQRRLRNRKIKAELKAIETTHNNLKKQIEYDKKLGVTFSFEKRNSKTDKKYLYRQKRGQKHEYVAKDWYDLDSKQEHEAHEQVWGDGYTSKGLSPAEKEIFDLLIKHWCRYKYDQNRIKRLKSEGNWRKNKSSFEYLSDPILRKGIEKLNLRRDESIEVPRSSPDEPIKEIFMINNLSIKERKKILQTTRKALIRRGNVDKKLESIARNMGEGEDTPQNIENFIVYLMKKIGLEQETDDHAIRALENYINRIILKDPKSMYAVLEPVEVRIFAENTVRRFKSMGCNFRCDPF
ncbi:MAG: hypothetical protein ACRD8W_29850 [Nitrososphaeraceae archaeon]